MVCALVKPTIMAATSRKKRMVPNVRERASFLHSAFRVGFPFALPHLEMFRVIASKLGSLLLAIDIDE